MKKDEENLLKAKAEAYEVVCMIEQRQAEIKELIRKRQELHQQINELNGD